MTQFSKLPVVLAVLIIVGIFFALQTAHAQENNRFRRDCNYYSEYNTYTETWGEWRKGSSTFVFNINENNDIKVIYPEGSTEILRNLGDKEEKKTTEGVTYQSLRVMDEKGVEGWIALYTDGEVGLYFKGFIFRYSP